MAPHYIVLAIGLVGLALAQLLVFLDKRRGPARRMRQLDPHPGHVGHRLQRMP